MSAISDIEWTDATWNCVRGCVKVSPGCKHCYAETFAERWRGVSGHPYQQGFDPMTVAAALDKPMHWKKPKRIFVNSMSDLFGEFVSDQYIAAVFGVMAACPQHTFQVLTKRAERLPLWFKWLGHHEVYTSKQGAILHYAQNECTHATLRITDPILTRPWPLPNVHLGVSVEDRKYGLPRIEHLRRTPAALRFLSIEPQLEDIADDLDLTGIDWVIIGGESGPGARPLNIDWVYGIVAKCRAQRVPVFVKQLGAWAWDGANSGLAPHHHAYGSSVRALRLPLLDSKGGNPDEWPEDLRIREWPRSICQSLNHRTGEPAADLWTCSCGRTVCASCEGASDESPELCDQCHLVLAASRGYCDLERHSRRQV